ncbi:MAG: F0F1 ATP synthase subunit B' [Geminicoccaceae bacterium]
MPQIEVSTFSSQIFWLIICFATLYYLLSRRALPRVSEILEARQDRIAADLDQAQRLRREAEAALSTYEQAMAKAQDEAHALLAEVQNRLQAEAAERQAELDRQLAGQLAEAEARIATARERALAEMADAAVGAVQAAAQRLAGLKVSQAAAKAAVRRVVGGTG